MKVFGVVVFSLCVLAIPHDAHALGITPSTITENDLANGLKIEREFWISTGADSMSVDRYFDVEVKGQGADFIELSSDIHVIPAGQQAAPFTFFLHPINAPNGEFNVTLEFNGRIGPPEGIIDSSYFGLGVTSGVIGKVNFSVSDKHVRRYHVQSVLIADSEENQNLVLKYEAYNDGNRLDKPDQIRVVVAGSPSGELVELSADVKSIELTPVKERTVVSVPVEADFGIGKYKAQVYFYQDGREIALYDDVLFAVHPEGSLSQEASISSMKFNKNHFDASSELLIIDVDIQNTGSVKVEPVLFLEFYLDEELVELLRSEKSAPLDPGKTTQYTEKYRPGKEGIYTVRAYIEYGIHRTDAIRDVFTVGKKFKKAHEKMQSGDTGGVSGMLTGKKILGREMTPRQLALIAITVMLSVATLLLAILVNKIKHRNDNRGIQNNAQIPGQNA